MPTQTREEHPFAEYIRILGKGKRGARPLTREQAHTAMTMIMNSEVQPIQLGAFLMLMRVKEETAEELAGFIQAARESLQNRSKSVTVDLDWSSYAGKRRHLPWFILSALLLAENGIKVFMHGASGHTANRVYTEDALEFLGIDPALSLAEAEDRLHTENFCFLRLNNFCPMLQEMIELRPLLGLRSPVHTLARMMNPLQAHCCIQGIFHPGYRIIHQQAAQLIEQPHLAVFKGEGGEVERNPDVSCLVLSVHNGVMSEEEWPALFARRHTKPDRLDPAQLKALWRGKYSDEFAEASVMGTTAIALKLLGKAENQKQAETLAGDFWSNRNKNNFPAGSARHTAG